MNKLDTFEMLAQIMENPNKMFKGTSEDLPFPIVAEVYGEFCQENSCFQNVVVVDYGGAREVFTVSDFHLGFYWEEMAQPVSFMEAVESGKEMRVDVNGLSLDGIERGGQKTYKSLLDTMQELLLLPDSYARRAILEGDWYLKPE